jgi:hypothetical protein
VDLFLATGGDRDYRVVCASSGERTKLNLSSQSNMVKEFMEDYEEYTGATSGDLAI